MRILVSLSSALASADTATTTTTKTEKRRTSFFCHKNLDITELHFIRCEIPVKWFQNNHFTHLKRLDLDYSSRADHTHIRDCLGQKKLSETLESLSLKGCYRVEDRTVELLPQLTALAELNLDETSITQFGLQIICKELSSTLNRLSLRRCSKLKLDDKTLQFVKDSFCDNLDFKFIH